MSAEDFDHFQALGDIILAERKGHVVMTTGGLHLADKDQTPIWIVKDVGPNVKDKRLTPGQRIMFTGGALVPYDGRTFILLHEADVVGIMPVPDAKLIEFPKTDDVHAAANNVKKLISLQ